MKLFKESKHQPIKLRNFKYIGIAKDYPNICYYYKELPRDNFEIMTCALEGTVNKPEIGAGTNVKVIDIFMANYLFTLKHEPEIEDLDFITYAINGSFHDLEKDKREEMIKKFSSKIPSEIRNSKSYIQAKEDGYKLLYCSNDESKDRVFGIVNVVMYKDIKVKSDDKRLNIDSNYTSFRPLKYIVSANYIKGLSKEKYMEVKQEDIVIDNDLLN